MSLPFVVWKYQAKLFLRNKVLVLGVFVLLVAALFAAGYGSYFVKQQSTVIHAADTAFQNRLEQSLKLVDKGIALHYSSVVKELAVYRPTPMASLAIGQKDNYPFYQQVGVNENVYAVTSGEIQNPLKLLAGNFDLSYVLIYLFPLFIIVFGYNVLAEEKENSTYMLLQIHGNGEKVILNKLAFRLVVMLLLSLAVNLLAFTMNGISWKAQGSGMLAWILITMLYISFWFALVYFIVSLGKSSGITALMLSGLWVLFLFLAPSVIYKNVAHPQERQQVQSLFNQRGDYQAVWKMDSVTLLNAYRKLQLPYTFPAPVEDRRLAMNVKSIMASEVRVRQDSIMSIKPLQQQAEEYWQTLGWNWVNPVFAVQNAYNQLAGTEINNYHDYLHAVNRHQSEKRYLVHTQLLAGIPITRQSMERLPRFSYTPMCIGCGEALALMLPVLFLSCLFVVLGSLNRKRLLR